MNRVYKNAKDNYKHTVITLSENPEKILLEAKIATKIGESINYCLPRAIIHSNSAKFLF